MSRLGKKPIAIPEGVEVKKEENLLIVKGSLGELKRELHSAVSVEVKDGEVEVLPTKGKEDDLFAKALWGTYSSHVINMIEGVTKGFEKTLIFEGTGYKAKVEGSNLVLSLGYSHDIPMAIPEGLKVEVEKNEIKIGGIDKELVGEFAAKVRIKRKPEPYKGKGVRYSDEVIERKQGKKAVA